MVQIGTQMEMTKNPAHASPHHLLAASTTIIIIFVTAHVLAIPASGNSQLQGPVAAIGVVSEASAFFLQQSPCPWKPSSPPHPYSTGRRDFVQSTRQPAARNDGRSKLDRLNGVGIRCPLDWRRWFRGSTGQIGYTDCSLALGAQDSTLGGAVEAATSPSATVAARTTSGGTTTLGFWDSMICGAVSRGVAKTLTHPANTMKTILQTSPRICTTSVDSNGSAVAKLPSLMRLPRPSRPSLDVLWRGAGAQFMLSGLLGAVNFAVLEWTRDRMGNCYEMVKSRRTQLEGKHVRTSTTDGGGEEAIGAAMGMDFLSSAVSTVACSVLSVPQMVIMDNIMAGTYPDLASAVTGLTSLGGVSAFYRGWWPHLAVKIPSYAISWTCFQRLKVAHRSAFHRPPTDLENTLMGCVASGISVCVMIPLETVKTRLVTQTAMMNPNLIPYSGIVDGISRIVQEEGGRSLYLGLTPRLASVVPMMGIQFGVYEFMKRTALDRQKRVRQPTRSYPVPQATN